MNFTDPWKAAVDAIEKADVLLITAGAGIGVDSGLPDFRGEGGFWNTQKKDKQKFDFINTPQKAWYFYGYRLFLYQNTKPHEGFDQLLTIAQSKKDYYVFTSNVDEHFQKAGFDRAKIEECHGSLFNWQCSRDCQNKIIDAQLSTLHLDHHQEVALQYLTCPDCEQAMRPNVMLFGDHYWNPFFSKEQGVENLYRLRDLEQMHHQFVVIEIGAGTAIPTVRREGEKLAQKYKTTLIRINPYQAESTAEQQILLPYSAKDAIGQIFKRLSL